MATEEGQELTPQMRVAIKDHIERALKPILSELKADQATSFDSLRTSLTGEIAKLAPAKADPKKGEEDPTAKEVRELKETLRLETEARKAAETRQRSTKEDTEVLGAMEKAGIRPGLRKPLLAVLRQEGKLKTDEAGKVLIAHRELGDHFADFIATDEGREFLPATGAGGSGTGTDAAAPGTQGKTPADKPTMAQLNEVAAKTFG